ncbi:MAG: LPS export ABC transporter permease LptF [Hyphomicrobiales bacterium]|nr:MAG: LPS export ABC transporter permease LptF [Hyphomicrobiales bacterium]
MRLIERYILARVGVSFVVVLVTLIGVVYMTQALRRLDLVTAKGQTVFLFLKITFLAIPSLALIVAPFALAIAVVTVLNQLNSESELVVINAAGASPSILLRPLMAVGVAVGIVAFLLAHWIGPAGLRALRAETTQIRADLVANIIKPGRFIEIDDNLTFHIRDRLGDGSLAGLLLDDRRNPEESFAYLAERGEVLRALDRTLILMHEGTIQRRTPSGEISIVEFQSYGFDLTSLMPAASNPVYKSTERSFSELINPDPDDGYAQANLGRLRSELHDRFMQPFYPIVFVLVVLVFLGEARTTRQSRGLGVLAALIGCFGIRFIGFAAVNISITKPLVTPLIYLVPLSAGAFATWLIVTDRRLETPRVISIGVEKISSWIASRFGGNGAAA